MMPNEMTCQELVELVTDYFEGKLSTEDNQRFEYHITECPGCVAYVEQMQTTIKLVGQLREHELANDSANALLYIYRNWKSTSDSGSTT